MAINVKTITEVLTPPKAAEKIIGEQMANLATIDNITNIDVHNAMASVALATTAKKFNFLDSLKSRKLWMAVGFALVVAINAKFGHILNNNDLLLILGATGGFIGVEGVADIVSRMQSVKSEDIE